MPRAIKYYLYDELEGEILNVTGAFLIEDLIANFKTSCKRGDVDPDDFKDDTSNRITILQSVGSFTPSKKIIVTIELNNGSTLVA